MARKYKFKLNPDLPVDDAFLDHMDAVLSQLGIAPDVAQHLVSGYEKYMGQALARQAADAQRAADAVRQEYGAGYTEGIAKGQKAIRSLGLGQADLEALDRAAGTGAAARLLIKLGQRFDAQGSPTQGSGTTAHAPSAGATGGGSAFDSPEQARAEIDRLSRSKAWTDKLFDPKAEGHAEAKEHWNQLHAAAYPAAEPAAAPADSGAAKERWNSLPQDVKDATTRRDSGGNTRERIDALTQDEAFMGSLRDPQHPEHAANRQTFDQLHHEAGLK